VEISEENKLEILLSQLHERYEALHKMRDRSMQFTLWILGFGLGLVWLLINEIVLTLGQRITITIILLLIFIVTFIFVKAIGNGFAHNLKIMINIEKALQLYEKDTYGIGEAILPKEFCQQKIKLTGHFSTLYALIATVFLLLIILTWTNPCKRISLGVHLPTDPNQMQIRTVNE
jgi:hypothetical protein